MWLTICLVYLAWKTYKQITLPVRTIHSTFITFLTLYLLIARTLNILIVLLQYLIHPASYLVLKNPNKTARWSGFYTNVTLPKMAIGYFIIVIQFYVN